MAYFDRWEFYIFLKIWKLKNILLYLYYVCDIRSHSKLMLSWCKGIYTKFICKAKDFYEFVFCVDSFIFFYYLLRHVGFEVQVTFLLRFAQ